MRNDTPIPAASQPFARARVSYGIKSAVAAKSVGTPKANETPMSSRDAARIQKFHATKAMIPDRSNKTPLVRYADRRSMRSIMGTTSSDERAAAPVMTVANWPTSATLTPNSRLISLTKGLCMTTPSAITDWAKTMMIMARPVVEITTDPAWGSGYQPRGRLQSTFVALR